MVISTFASISKKWNNNWLMGNFWCQFTGSNLSIHCQVLMYKKLYCFGITKNRIIKSCIVLVWLKIVELLKSCIVLVLLKIELLKVALFWYY
jgi:hypothetical protein